MLGGTLRSQGARTGVWERGGTYPQTVCSQELRAGLISMNLYLSKVKVSGLI